MAKLSASKHPEKMALNNSGTSELAKMRQISSIKVHPDFQNLFTINPRVLNQIRESIKKNGFDKSKPLDIWKEQDALMDGYTRLQAARIEGLFEVPVYEHSFKTLTDALEYTLGIQIARRNLTDGELVLAVGKLDTLKKVGRKTTGESAKGRSSEQLAEKLGINSRKVEKIRAIEKSGDEETKEAVKGGKLSINAAYNKTKTKNKPLPEPRDPVITKPAEPDFDPLPPNDPPGIELVLPGIKDHFECMSPKELGKDLICNVCVHTGEETICKSCIWKREKRS
jgi:hypothetical protein